MKNWLPVTILLVASTTGCEESLAYQSEPDSAKPKVDNPSDSPKIERQLDQFLRFEELMCAVDYYYTEEQIALCRAARHWIKVHGPSPTIGADARFVKLEKSLRKHQETRRKQSLEFWKHLLTQFPKVRKRRSLAAALADFHKQFPQCRKARAQRWGQVRDLMFAARPDELRFSNVLAKSTNKAIQEKGDMLLRLSPDSKPLGKLPTGLGRQWIRYDGVYYQGPGKGNIQSFVRFYNDGTVLQFSAAVEGKSTDKSIAHTALLWMTLAPNKWVSKGSYELQKHRVTLSMKSGSSDKKVKGTFERDFLTLTFPKGEQRYRFVPADVLGD